MPKVGERSRTMPPAKAGLFVATAPSLLQEYTAKLDSLVDHVQELVSRRTDELSEQQKRIQKQQGLILMSRINRLAKSTADLARRVSQLVEHGDLDDDSMFELRLRLADLEAAREAAVSSVALAVMAGGS